VGIAFHTAEGTCDDGRVAWRSVSRLKQWWQPPGLIDLLHGHRLIDQPSTCLAMCSCPDRSRRSERRLYWFVGSVLVAASMSSNSARGPSAVAESMITVITAPGPPSWTDPPRAHGGLVPAMIGVRRPDLVVARVRREINVAGFARHSPAQRWPCLLSPPPSCPRAQHGADRHMDTHHPVDLLGDREGRQAEWLWEHPAVQVVCRDRAPNRSPGSRQSREVGQIQIFGCH
jgi:hypothetical protein